jgi:hypothetical protein
MRLVIICWLRLRRQHGLILANATRLPPGMVQLSFSHQLESIWRQHVQEASVRSTPCVYLDEKRARSQKSISDSSSSCGVPCTCSCRPSDSGSIIARICENDPRFFTREEMHGSRSLPDFIRNKTCFFFFTFQQEELAALLQKQVKKPHVLSESSMPIELWTHIRETGKQDHSHQTWRKLWCHSSSNQTTISKPNKWVALAIKANLSYYFF